MRLYMQNETDDDWNPLCMCYRRMFNAVPDEVSPGNVVEPWQPGDFAAHLTMLPVEQRVALFHEISRRVK